MVDYYQKLKELEKELSNTKYNKKTQFHIGLLKARIAKLRALIEKRSNKSRSQGFHIKKSGDATVIIVGFPSAGKSTLLTVLTNKESEVGDYDFTTLRIIPGIMEYNHAKIQILDAPGIIEGASLGKGRGKEVLSAIRSADLCLIVIDATNIKQLEKILKELYNAGIIINQKPPDVKIIKKVKGNINIWTSVKLTHLNETLIKEILKEFKILSADIIIREDITVDQFINVIEGNKKYMPALKILNKIDLISKAELDKIKDKFDLCISAKNKTNIEELKEIIFKKLDLIRIYLKKPGKQPDLKEPLIMKKGCTIKDVCEKLHKELVLNFKYARVWGNSVKFPGQRKMLDHILTDNDIVEIHTR